MLEMWKIIRNRIENTGNHSVNTVISHFKILHPDLFLILDIILHSKRKPSVFYGRKEDPADAGCHSFLKVVHTGGILDEICWSILKKVTIQARNFVVFCALLVYKFASKITALSLAQYIFSLSFSLSLSFPLSLSLSELSKCIMLETRLIGIFWQIKLHYAFRCPKSKLNV